jgi:hypothetical protein
MYEEGRALTAYTCNKAVNDCKEPSKIFQVNYTLKRDLKLNSYPQHFNNLVLNKPIRNGHQSEVDTPLRSMAVSYLKGI